MRNLPEDRRVIRALLPALAVVFLAALDLTVVAPILPQIIVDLNIGTADADRYAWIVLSYLVAYTVTVPIAGKLSDRFGRLPVFLTALVIFTLGSTLSAAAGSLSELIVGRTAQGLGGGAMLPVSMALVADVVPAWRRVSVLGLVAAVDTFGWVLGPLWGSAISATTGSWRAVFWLNIPIAIAAAVVLISFRPSTERAGPGAGVNIINALLGGAGLALVSLALSTGSEGGISGEGERVLGGTGHPLAAYRWPAFIGGFALLLIFALLERWSRDPLIPRDLIRQRGFQLAAAANVLTGVALIVALVNAPLAIAVLSDVDEQTRNSSILLGGFAALMTVGAILGGRLSSARSPALAAATGLLVASGGFFWMVTWPDRTDLTLMTSSIAVAGVGLGVVIAPIADAAISRAEIRAYGVASGMVLLARLIGMTLGLAAITRYGIERLESRLAALPPLRPEEGETTSEFFERQQDYVEAEAIPITLDVIRETFLAGALICLVTIVVAIGLGYERDRRRTSRNDATPAAGPDS